MDSWSIFDLFVNCYPVDIDHVNTQIQIGIVAVDLFMYLDVIPDDWLGLASGEFVFKACHGWPKYFLYIVYIYNVD